MFRYKMAISSLEHLNNATQSSNLRSCKIPGRQKGSLKHQH